MIVELSWIWNFHQDFFAFGPIFHPTFADPIREIHWDFGWRGRFMVFDRLDFEFRRRVCGFFPEVRELNRDWHTPAERPRIFPDQTKRFVLVVVVEDEQLFQKFLPSSFVKHEIDNFSHGS